MKGSAKPSEIKLSSQVSLSFAKGQSVRSLPLRKFEARVMSIDKVAALRKLRSNDTRKVDVPAKCIHHHEDDLVKWRFRRVSILQRPILRKPWQERLVWEESKGEDYAGDGNESIGE